MSLTLTPYPNYKNTDVPWLGSVPQHWEVVRLGALLMERGETNENRTVSDVLSVLRDVGVIPYKEKGNIGNKASEDISRYKIVRPDDIVVNCMNVIIGSVGLSRLTGCLSPVYYVLQRRSDKDDSRYLSAYFQAKPFQQSLVRIGNGILAHRMRIPMELLKCEPFPRPPLDEQVQIVRFVEHADRSFRKLIGAKRRLIELLNEQKQAIISRAVTRGLDPHVRLKPSGVEWLGDIPDHWELKRLKYVVPSVTVGIVIQPARLYVPSGIPCLRSLNISGGSISTDAMVFISPESHRLNLKSELHCDDIVIVRTGRAGVAVRIPQELQGANCIDLLVIRRSAKLLPGFLVDFLNSHAAQTEVQYRSVGAIQAHYNTTTLANMLVPVPSIDEQRAVTEHLKRELSGLEAALRAAENEIHLLREYRTRLIADVVTGKLDVRGVKLPEFDADEVQEPLSDAEDEESEDAGEMVAAGEGADAD